MSARQNRPVCQCRNTRTMPNLTKRVDVKRKVIGQRSVRETLVSYADLRKSSDNNGKPGSEPSPFEKKDIKLETVSKPLLYKERNIDDNNHVLAAEDAIMKREKDVDVPLQDRLMNLANYGKMTRSNNNRSKSTGKENRQSIEQSLDRIIKNDTIDRDKKLNNETIYTTHERYDERNLDQNCMENTMERSIESRRNLASIETKRRASIMRETQHRKRKRSVSVHNSRSSKIMKISSGQNMIYKKSRSPRSISRSDSIKFDKVKDERRGSRHKISNQEDSTNRKSKSPERRLISTVGSKRNREENQKCSEYKLSSQENNTNRKSKSPCRRSKSIESENKKEKDSGCEITSQESSTYIKSKSPGRRSTSIGSEKSREEIQKRSEYKLSHQKNSKNRNSKSPCRMSKSIASENKKEKVSEYELTSQESSTYIKSTSPGRRSTSTGSENNKKEKLSEYKLIKEDFTYRKNKSPRRKSAITENKKSKREKECYEYRTTRKIRIKDYINRRDRSPRRNYSRYNNEIRRSSKRTPIKKPRSYHNSRDVLHERVRTRIKTNKSHRNSKVNERDDNRLERKIKSRVDRKEKLIDTKRGGISESGHCVKGEEPPAEFHKINLLETGKLKYDNETTNEDNIHKLRDTDNNNVGKSNTEDKNDKLVSDQLSVTGTVALPMLQMMDVAKDQEEKIKSKLDVSSEKEEGELSDSVLENSRFGSTNENSRSQTDANITKLLDEHKTEKCLDIKTIESIENCSDNKKSKDNIDIADEGRRSGDKENNIVDNNIENYEFDVNSLCQNEEINNKIIDERSFHDDSELNLDSSMWRNVKKALENQRDSAPYYHTESAETEDKENITKYGYNKSGESRDKIKSTTPVTYNTESDEIEHKENIHSHNNSKELEYEINSLPLYVTEEVDKGTVIIVNNDIDENIEDKRISSSFPTVNSDDSEMSLLNFIGNSKRMSNSSSHSSTSQMFDNKANSTRTNFSNAQFCSPIDFKSKVADVIPKDPANQCKLNFLNQIISPELWPATCSPIPKGTPENVVTPNSSMNTVQTSSTPILNIHNENKVIPSFRLSIGNKDSVISNELITDVDASDHTNKENKSNSSAGDSDSIKSKDKTMLTNVSKSENSSLTVKRRKVPLTTLSRNVTIVMSDSENTQDYVVNAFGTRTREIDYIQDMHKKIEADMSLNPNGSHVYVPNEVILGNSSSDNSSCESTSSQRTVNTRGSDNSGLRAVKRKTSNTSSSSSSDEISNSSGNSNSSDSSSSSSDSSSSSCSTNTSKNNSTVSNEPVSFTNSLEINDIQKENVKELFNSNNGKPKINIIENNPTNNTPQKTSKIIPTGNILKASDSDSSSSSSSCSTNTSKNNSTVSNEPVSFTNSLEFKDIQKENIKELFNSNDGKPKINIIENNPTNNTPEKTSKIIPTGNILKASDSDNKRTVRNSFRLCDNSNNEFESKNKPNMKETTPRMFTSLSVNADVSVEIEESMIEKHSILLSNSFIDEIQLLSGCQEAPRRIVTKVRRSKGTLSASENGEGSGSSVISHVISPTMHVKETVKEINAEATPTRPPIRKVIIRRRKKTS